MDESWTPTYRRTALSCGGWHGPWPMFRIGVSPEGLSIPVLGSRVGRSVTSSAGLGRIPVSDIEEIARAGGIFQFGYRLVLTDGTLMQMWSPRLPSLLNQSPDLARLVRRDGRKWFWSRRSLPPWVSGRMESEPGGSGSG